LLLTGVKNSFGLSFESRPKIILMRILLLFFLCIWIVGFLLPGISSINNSLFDFLLVKIYSTVCHQESAKCISIGNSSMLVCARCAGIYFGALISGLTTLIFSVHSISRRVLILALIPLAIDVLFTFTGIYTYSQRLAFITGLSFGGILYLVIISEFENLFSKKLFIINE
jgi:uncharacterized membrane protein